MRPKARPLPPDEAIVDLPAFALEDVPDNPYRIPLSQAYFYGFGLSYAEIPFRCSDTAYRNIACTGVYWGCRTWWQRSPLEHLSALCDALLYQRTRALLPGREERVARALYGACAAPKVGVELLGLSYHWELTRHEA